jgi:hypothetical protein
MQPEPAPEPARKIERKKWNPAAKSAGVSGEPSQSATVEPTEIPQVEKPAAAPAPVAEKVVAETSKDPAAEIVNPVAPERKKWQPKPKGEAKS